MENLMPQMMGNFSQMLKLYKGDPDSPTLTESITWPYNAGFMQAMKQVIKEM